MSIHLCKLGVLWTAVQKIENQSLFKTVFYLEIVEHLWTTLKKLLCEKRVFVPDTGPHQTPSFRTQDALRTTASVIKQFQKSGTYVNVHNLILDPIW
jgi:hypothetical protein